MQLLIIRHGIAVPRGTPGIRDEKRPLTERGEQRFQKAALGLASLLPAPDALLTSPLVRARRTADIAAQAWGKLKPITAAALVDARFDDVMHLISTHRPAQLIALVGHEPSLSALVATLLGSADAERLALRKGGAVLLELLRRPHDGARLIWALPPKILRALA